MLTTRAFKATTQGVRATNRNFSWYSWRPTALQRWERNMQIGMGATLALSLIAEGWSTYTIRERELRGLIEQSPGNIKARAELGLHLARRKDFPGAKAALHTAAQLDPEDPLPRMCLAFALAELQLDREGAEQELLKAVEHMRCPFPPPGTTPPSRLHIPGFMT